MNRPARINEIMEENIKLLSIWGREAGKSVEEIQAIVQKVYDSSRAHLALVSQIEASFAYNKF